MALVIDKDGKETIGGIAQIRDAFVQAGDGRLSCSQATMTHDNEGGTQVLRFMGVWSVNGTPFDISEGVPNGQPLAPAARSMARRLIEGVAP